MIRAFPILAFAALALVAGCLEARSGRQGTSDAADTTTTADAADTTEMVDVVDGCQVTGCDDGDPCTDDWCNEATGQCSNVYIGMAEPPECDDDSQCDDGDRCTSDECVVTPGGECGSAWAYCRNLPIPGACTDCQANGCDDADPCTVDACRPDGSCDHHRQVHCVSECTSIGALSVDALRGSGYPQHVKVGGVVDLHPDIVCDLGATCPCDTAPAFLGADGWPLRLVSGSDAHVGLPFACKQGCGNDVPVCQPMSFAGAYWVWGQPSSGYPYAPFFPDDEGGEEEDPGVPVAPIDTLVVVDYCLQTNAGGLAGKYTGHWAPDGLDQSIAVTAAIATAASGELTLTLTTAQCTNCPAYVTTTPSQTVPLTIHDGHVTFEAQPPSFCGISAARVRLFSQGNQLIGRYVDPWQDPYTGMGEADVASCANGVLTLTRQP